MAEGSNTHTLPLVDPAVENGNKIKPLSEDSAMQHIQKGMSQLAPPSSATQSQLSSNKEVIDSALSAAMRDPRERVSLLRLEQVMMEFMNSSDGYLEVGGPYNSVVISPNKTNPDGTLSSMQPSSYTRPATSFQRCLLHRLADRFGILREAGSLMEGSIRLVKQKESKIPKCLLLDHTSSVNSVHEENYLGSGNGNNAGGLNHNHSNISMDPWQQPMTSSSTQLNSQNNAGGKSNSKRKMKIMKRSSSGADGLKNNLRNSGGNNSGNAQRSRKSKNFSDKEKAYAEARARIFNQENSASSAQTTTSSGTKVQGQFQNTTIPAAASVFPSYGVNNLGNSYTNSYTVGGYPLPKPSSSLSLTHDTEDEDIGISTLVPAATTGMGIVPTKATWRNRRQEENDPDFQRGTLITQPMAAAVPTTAASLHPSSFNYYTTPAGYQQGNPYHDDAAYYPYPTTKPNVMGASAGRGAAATVVGRSGRGFNVQNTPRSSYNPYAYPKPGNQTPDDTANLNSMEEFPELR